jgi:hypothetical protein
MDADAIPWIAFGLLLLLSRMLRRAIVLAQRALRGGGEFEMEVKAPLLSFRLRVKAGGQDDR